MKPELAFFWSAVALYGVSTFSYIFGFIAKQEKLFTVDLEWRRSIRGFASNTTNQGVSC